MVGAGGDAAWSSLILFRLILQKESMIPPTPQWPPMGNIFSSGARHMKLWEDMACFHSMYSENMNWRNFLKYQVIESGFVMAWHCANQMYRTFSAMWEGWSKGLAILFRDPYPGSLAHA